MAATCAVCDDKSKEIAMVSTDSVTEKAPDTGIIRLNGKRIARRTLAVFGIGLLAGAVIGGVVALLYTPKSGKETRELLKNKAMKMRGGATSVAGHVRDFAIHTPVKVKAAVSALKN